MPSLRERQHNWQLTLDGAANRRSTSAGKGYRQTGCAQAKSVPVNAGRRLATITRCRRHWIATHCFNCNVTLWLKNRQVGSQAATTGDFDADPGFVHRLIHR